MKILKKGQSSAEYAVLVVAIIASFMAMVMYLRRGVQGRWKEAADNIGEQYDPTEMETNITYTTEGRITSNTTTEEDDDGYWTMRKEVTTSTENKVGTTRVGNYF